MTRSPTIPVPRLLMDHKAIPLRFPMLSIGYVPHNINTRKHTPTQPAPQHTHTQTLTHTLTLNILQSLEVMNNREKEKAQGKTLGDGQSAPWL